MDDLHSLIHQIATSPSPAVLWELYGRLLAAGADPMLLKTVEAFHHYLCDLQGKATARQFAELASLLDIGAVGGVAIENLVGGGSDHLFKRFLLGTVSESLMVMASRQYVKGWQSELHSTHCQAAWFLAGELWRLSNEMQPDLPAEQRWEGIKSLVAPARDEQSPNGVKAVLLGWLFQVILLIRTRPLL